MKALIVPSCTDLNRGDQALAWEAERFLKDAGFSDIAIINYGDTEEERSRQSNQTQDHGLKVLNNFNIDYKYIF